MESYLLKGILIGLLFGVPIGAVGTMTVERTWNQGWKAGLVTGLGSSVADCFYAVVGAFGLTAISDFLFRYQTVIHLVGGGLILCMGIGQIRKRADAVVVDEKTMGGARLFLSSFAIGITNPAVILTFLFAFSYFGISGVSRAWEGIGLVGGVLIGTYLWWGVLTVGTCAIKKRTRNHRSYNMNRVFGCFLSLFGVVILGRCILG